MDWIIGFVTSAMEPVMKTVPPCLASVVRLTPIVLLYAAACAPDAGSAGPPNPVTLDLTTTEVTEPDVAVSPDGRSLVFTLVGHLFRVPIEGGEAEQLTFGLGYDFDPAFSPDGGRLAFVSDRDGTDGNVFVRDLASREVRQVTREPFGAARPAWSLDGSRIAYLGLVEPENGPRLSSHYRSVVNVVAVGGGDVVETVAPESFYTATLFLRDGRLAWAETDPDDRFAWEDSSDPVTRLVARDDRERLDTLFTLAGMVHRVSQLADGFLARQVLEPRGFGFQAERVVRIHAETGELESIAAVTGTGGWDWGPAVAFDSVSGRLFYGEEGRLLNLSLADPGDSMGIPFRAEVQHQARRRIRAPRWSPAESVPGRPRELPAISQLPDGAGLLVVAAGQLWHLDSDGGPAVRLHGETAFVRDVIASPAGDRAALLLRHDNLEILKVIDLEGGEAREVDLGRRYSGLAWSPDGSLLTFRDGRSGAYMALDPATGETAALADSAVAAALTGKGMADETVHARGGKLYGPSTGGSDTTEILRTTTFPFRPPPPLMIRGVHVLDVKAGRFTDTTTLLIEDGRIRAMGEAAEDMAPDDLARVSGAGRYVIPGLFDMHMHFYGMRASYVAFGVTSVREMGNGSSSLAEARTFADLGDLHPGPYPRTFHSGVVYGQPVDRDRQPLAALRDAGGSWAKVYATQPWYAQAQVGEDARAAGLPVAAHGMTPREIVKGITLGFASLEHIGYGVREDLAGLMAAAGVLWVPTIGAMAGDVLPEYQDALEIPARAARAFGWDVGAAETDSHGHGRLAELRPAYARHLESISLAHRMGVDISTGTDPGSFPTPPGLALHSELEHLVRAGIPPIDVLRMATLTAAREVGAGDDLGSIEVGKLADLVLLDANPLEDIRNTRRIWRVIKGGWVLDPAAIMTELAALRERAEDQPTTRRN